MHNEVYIDSFKSNASKLFHVTVIAPNARTLHYKLTSDLRKPASCFLVLSTIPPLQTPMQHTLISPLMYVNTQQIIYSLRTFPLT